MSLLASYKLLHPVQSPCQFLHGYRPSRHLSPARGAAGYGGIVGTSPTQDVPLLALVDPGGRGHLLQTDGTLKLLPPLFLLALRRTCRLTWSWGGYRLSIFNNVFRILIFGFQVNPAEGIECRSVLW